MTRYTAAILFCLTLHLTPAHVERCIDGDTCVLYNFDTPPYEHIRVLDVDTPEKK